MLYARGPCDEGTLCIAVPATSMDASAIDLEARIAFQEALTRHEQLLSSQPCPPISCDQQDQLLYLYATTAQQSTSLLHKVVAENNTAQIFYQRGQYEDALAALGRSLDLARHARQLDAGSGETVSDDWLTTILSNIGRVHFILERYQEALQYSVEALQAAREVVDRAFTAALWYNMALLLRLLGKGLGESYYALRRAHDHITTDSSTLRLSSNPGVRRRDIVTVQTFLLLVQAQRDEEKDSADDPTELLSCLIAQREQVGYQHFAVARTLCSLGTLYMRKEEYDYASHFLAEALRVQRHIQACEQDILITSIQLGQCLQDTGRHTEAMACFRWVLQTKTEKSFQDQKPQAKALFATVLYNIGMIQSSHGDRADQLNRQKALLSFRLCLELRRSCFGPDHPAIASVLHNIGILLLDDGQETQSLKSFEESLRIRIATYGPCHHEVASSLRHIGQIYQDRGYYEKALKLHEEALSIWRRDHDSQDRSRNLIVGLIGMGQAQHSLGQMDQALQSYEEAAELLRLRRQRGHANADAHIVRLLNIMGNVSIDMSNLTRAQAFFDEAARLSGHNGAAFNAATINGVAPCAAAA